MGRESATFGPCTVPMAIQPDHLFRGAVGCRLSNRPWCEAKSPPQVGHKSGLSRVTCAETLQTPRGGERHMATDYDTPRKTDDDVDSDSLEELKARRNDKSTSAVDVDEFEAAEGLELPGADLSNEELAVRVLPKQQDEFTCMSCFLVHHRSQLAGEKSGQPICRDCD